MGKELEHSVEVGQTRAIAVDEFAEGVFTVGEVIGIFGCFLGNAGQEFGVHPAERFGRPLAGACQLRIGFLPGLQLGGPLPMLERNLAEQFRQQFALLLPLSDKFPQQNVCLGDVSRRSRSTGRRGSSGNVDLREERRDVSHD